MIKPLIVIATLTAIGSANADQWQTNFFDDFNQFDKTNWQDQRLWVNNEDQCYLPDGQHNTREVSDGTLKLRVIKLEAPIECDNVDKFGNIHPPTQYVAGRIASKNLREFTRGKWSARLKLHGDGQKGMFPAWWILGARNNEPPVQQADEDVCWPLPGSGELDIFEHYGAGGSGHYTARAIKSEGSCDKGDWKSLMKVIDADLNEYQVYSVEWLGDDLVYRLNEKEVYRNEGINHLYNEPFFAILNYAKIDPAPMEQSEWLMEVDWVKHEVLSNESKLVE
ncbi:MAG: glycoside hydrolase family 16 protein [Gammaproteobacteria bacterium]|nr:glycoside hydrolase family 16 protein [Gammaproteobacteria bacterium]